MTAKTITLRVPPPLHDKVSAIARIREISLNQLINETLTQLTKAEEEARLFDDFTRLGADLDASDVTFAESAQAEVVGNHEKD